MKITPTPTLILKVLLYWQLVLVLALVAGLSLQSSMVLLGGTLIWFAGLLRLLWRLKWSMALLR